MLKTVLTVADPGQDQPRPILAGDHRPQAGFAFESVRAESFRSAFAESHTQPLMTVAWTSSM